MTARWRRPATTLLSSSLCRGRLSGSPKFGRQTLRRSHNPASHRRAPVARASAGSGRGLGPARRSRARRGEWGSSRARPAAARSGALPASRVLWSRPYPAAMLDCEAVAAAAAAAATAAEEGWGRSWEFSAVAGVRGQRPSGQSLRRERGASLSHSGPPSAPPSVASSLRRSCEMLRL